MFDEKIKNKFENHEVPVNPQLWNNIEKSLVTQGITTTGSSLFLKKVLPLIGIGLVTAGSIYFLINSTIKENTTSIIIKKEEAPKIVSKVTHVSNSKKSEIIDLPSTEKEGSTQASHKITPLISESNNSNSPEIETPIVFSEEIITSTTDNVEDIIPSTVDHTIEEAKKIIIAPRPTEVEKVEAVDKLHAAGEYVTVRVDFQNYAHEKTKHMKMWEEFPDWVDVRTFEMLDHKNSVKIKTRVIPSQNTVIWKVNGDFSNNINSEDSKGYLEYKIQLTQPTRASELEKLQPEVK